ncbi:MAG: universal stress protein [Candidatus Thiodiazotropha sp. (ex Cardiolucina cf. quadrata)]|nr:universal stress protein [Candidatus Thiodiazotropha sp. (ex Cardiolucina cf. quadrata)]
MAERPPGPGAVCAYLAEHGINAAAEILEPGNEYKGEALPQKTRSHDADLLVMGVYSKKRLRASVFGGVTQHLLAQAELPLFFSH